MADVDKIQPDKVSQLLEELRDKFIFEERISQWANQYEAGHIEHYKSLVENIGGICKKKNVSRLLDVGGVPGHLAAILKHAGFDVTVADISPERAKGLFDAMDIPYHKVDVENEPLPFSDASYDLVVFSEILEHLRINPFNALTEIYRVLRPGGVCLLSTPQITALMRWRFLLGHDYQDDVVTEYAKLDTIGHMGHIRLYSKPEVERMLRHIGFSVIRTSTGGRSAGRGGGAVASLLGALSPSSMKVQLYVWAEKP